MGLESLIPNRNNQQPQGNGGYIPRDRDDVEEIDVEETRYTVRRERDDLGVLSSLLAGTAHPRREQSPFQQTQSPYAVPQPDARDVPRETWNRPRDTYQEPQRPEAREMYRDSVSDSYQKPELPRYSNQDFEANEHQFGYQKHSSLPSFASAQPKTNREIPTLSGPIFQVEVTKIFENPYQPRKEFDESSLNELAASIREFGVLQPLVVTRSNEETEDGMRTTYQLIAGHRRLLASKKIGLKTVPVVIRDQLKKADALEMAIVENIQRQDLNAVETARAYARLSDEFGLTQREIAARLGKSRESIANTLRLLSLPTYIQDAISAGTINESHARILMQITDPVGQQHTFDQIVREGLSVRDTKRVLARAVPTGHAHGTHHTTNPELKSLEQDISEVVGAPVHIELSDKGGKIVIHFYSPEEVQGIAQRIKKEQQY